MKNVAFILLFHDCWRIIIIIIIIIIINIIIINIIINQLLLVPARARTDAFQAYSSVFKPDVTAEGEWNLTERHGAHAAGPKK